MVQRSTRGVPRIQSARGHLTLALLIAFLLPMAPGCGGCGSSSPPPTSAEKKKKEEEKEKKEKPKPKPDFEKPKLTVLPYDGQDLTQSVKPGHWVSATLDAKANNFDFSGDLEAGIMTASGVPIDLEHTAYRLFASRPVSLPKGQGKRLEILYFVPRSTTTTVATRLLARGGTEVLQDRQPVSHLPSYQYFMYVLSSQPDRYRYLKVLDSIKPPWDDLASKDRDQYYRVQLPRVGQSVSLPSHPLAWTSIAVLIWDDIHPKVLRKDQQQALIDWLHWGGQILVSGPRTLDLLKGSFLEPYLPATGGESTTLNEASLADLSKHWTVPILKGDSIPLAVTQPWPAVKLSQQNGAACLPGTGELLVERRVGRGRIVVSAFRLTERDLITWRSFDSLFNNALLRRPPRQYSEGQLAMLTLDWVGIANGRFDPALISNLRYFSRDSGTVEQRQKTQDKAGLPADIAQMLAQDPSYLMPPPAAASNFEMETYEDSRRVAEEAHQPGVAGWSDFTPTAHAAREALREAAGIVVPHRSFVVWVIGLYLLIIVPLNWLVFWALGRVEWAWVAAPAIAIACAMTVVKMARLDIGFARSKTEVAVLETQADYPRAHITRYTALYTSLSTGYDVHFEDPSALAAPFSTDPAFRLLTGQTVRPVMFRRDNEVHLTGYQISSNSTGMLHTEHMLDLGGSIQLVGAEDLAPRVSNGTRYTIEAAGVLRQEDGTTEYAWLGRLRPRQDMVLNFRPGAQRPEAEKAAEIEPSGASAINLQPLLRLAEETTDMIDGDIRLVGWADAEMPGMRIEPRSSQQRHATLIVANLRRGLGPTPQHDVNTRQEINQPEEDEGFDESAPLDANAAR